MNLQNFTLFLHVSGVIVWVGGMAFAWACLRPALAVLPPAQHIPVWIGVFNRFFPLVWMSIVLILASGFGKLAMIGFANGPRAWHWMMLTGLIMVAVFVSVWFGPWRRLRQAARTEDWTAGAAALSSIRRRIGVNLVLSGITVAIATIGLAVL